MAKIVVKIKPDGNTEVEGVNCSGDLCKVLSKPIEEALGIATEFVEKPEFYQETVQEQLQQEVKE